jgi:hypothetical protein
VVAEKQWHMQKRGKCRREEARDSQEQELKKKKKEQELIST